MSVKTIVVKGNPFKQEAFTASFCYPGQLLEYNTSGEVVKHTVAGGPIAVAMVAVEDDINPKYDACASPYLNDTVCQYVTPMPGDVLRMRCLTSTQVNVGGYLMSMGTGNLQPLTPVGTATMGFRQDAIWGVAKETIAASTNGVLWMVQRA